MNKDDQNKNKMGHVEEQKNNKVCTSISFC